MSGEMSQEKCNILVEIREIDDELELRWAEIQRLQRERLRIVERRRLAVLRLREVNNANQPGMPAMR
jgi:hypothetical protein